MVSSTKFSSLNSWNSIKNELVEMRLALFWFCCIILITNISSAFLPFIPSLNHSRTSIGLGTLLSLSDPIVWLEDPFDILEQLPLALERDEISVEISQPRVDWKETPKGHVINVDLPGLGKDQLNVELEPENRILRVSRKTNNNNNTNNRDEKAAGEHWHRVERSGYGKFLRQFRLPENVDLDSITASLENGVLTISISKLSPDRRIKGPKLVTIVEEQGTTNSHSQSQLNSDIKEEL